MGLFQTKTLNLWFYLIGFFDLFAVSIVVPLLPQYAKELGASPSIIGLFGSIYGATQLFSSPIIGHLGDVNGRVQILFISIMVCSGAYSLSSLLVKSLLLLAIFRLILGIFKHTQDMCRTSLAEICMTDEKTKCVGQFNAISTVGFIIGPSLAGQITNSMGLSKALPICFLLCGILFVVNALVVRFIVWPNAPVICKKDQNSLNDKKQKENKSLFVRIQEIDWRANGGMFLSRFLFAFSVLLYRSSFVLGVKNFYPHLSSAQLGYLLSYNAFIGFVFGMGGSWIFAHKYYIDNEEKLQLHASWFISVGTLLVATAWSIPMLMFGLVVLVIGTASSRACGVTLTIKRSTGNEAGKLLGLNSSIISIARSTAPFVAGIAQEYSYAAPAYLAFAVSLLAAFIFYFGVYCVPVEISDKRD